MPSEIVVGMITIERREDGWLFVQIGRHSRVKRFNLSDAEARELLAQLAARFGET